MSTKVNCIMSIRPLKPALVAILFAASSLALANESISIPAGSVHEGDLESRNGYIQVGDESVVDGSLESRNGHIETGVSVTAGDVYTRNGAIVLGAGGRYGDVESRNGSVELGEGTSTGDIETRNGGILVGSESRTGMLDSRNGEISVEADAVVDGAVQTRNGSVLLAPGSSVKGRITTRNGGVSLENATVEQGVQTLAGDIELRAGSRSGGDLTIEVTKENAGRNSGFFGIGGGTTWPEAGDIRVVDGSEVDGDVVLLLDAGYDEELPTVEIGSDAVVTGDLRIDSRVELIVAGTVNGEIERVTP